MKELSSRTRGLAQSDIRSVTAMVNAVDGINLGQGICDMAVPDDIKAGARRAIEDDRSIYTHYAGIKPLRKAIREKIKQYNRLPVQSDEEIMVSAGSTGAFVTAIFSLLGPGDEVILFEPFYGYHRNLLGLTGATIRYVPTRPPSWDVDFAALRAAITSRTKAVVLCTPSNPSGKVWSRADLGRLLAIVQEHDLFAVTDEIYEYMVYDEHEHVSLASLPGAFERTITISGFSKTYNMTGWRLGYAAGPEPLIEKMGLLNDLLYICAPAPLQYGVLEAFRMEETYFNELQQSYAAKRALICETLENCGFALERPQGAYYVMANFRPLAASRDGFDDDRTACETLIREAGVASVPGNSFFERPESGRYYLRFCYAKEMEVLQTACTRLLDAFPTAT